MSRDERARILTMLEEGKINASEAAELLRAVTSEPDRHSRLSGLEQLAAMFGGGMFRERQKMTKTEYNGVFTGDGPVAIEIDNVNGRVSVSGHNSEEYEVSIEHPEGNEDAFSFESGDDSLTIKVARKSVYRDRMSMKVKLPQRLIYKLDLVTVNGRIRLSELNCTEVKAVTANGRIDVAECVMERGEITTRNGRIELECGAQSLNVASRNGRIYVQPDPEVAGNYKVRTKVGSVKLKLKRRQGTGYSITADTGVGKVELDAGWLVAKKDDMDVTSGLDARSADFDQCTVPITIEAASGVGHIEVTD